ncbi:hypothetical protein [Actinomadura parmotrematis]|uniref:DUF1963 domain-containing protein n=1 Tax=Actinomadura parmotrematis TaxID=2864039 RepID=A0ABS7G297_9ACTN|nr:hypothetical protein [Actinomadura parmotrematis]MBW8486838.1 hypothetical protein [Actinomadura parmotrematis]
MTHEKLGTPGVDPVWRARLTPVFELLLGRPLDGFDPAADYAVYLGGNFINEIGFDRDPAWIAPAALAGAAPVVWDYPIFDQGEPPVRFDAGRSVFELDPADLPDGVPSFGRGLVRGADLAGRVPAADWYVPYPRLVSDGTLFDALRVALALGDGPGDLLDVDAEAGGEWAGALAGIEPPELAAHLGFFCTDGEAGLMYLGTERSGGPLLAGEGCELIAGWEEGQGQVELAVVRLGDRVAGRAGERAGGRAVSR